MSAKIAYAVATLAATAFLSNAVPVHAGTMAPDEVYTFTGQCADCTGTGIGTLTLSGYTQGDRLELADFVSFAYTSNLLHLSYNSTTSLHGKLVNLPSADTVEMVFNDGVAFESQTNGSWCTGSKCIQDMGASSLWTVAATATTPLPATLPLFASGLGVWGLLCRRRKRASATTG